MRVIDVLNGGITAGGSSFGCDLGKVKVGPRVEEFLAPLRNCKKRARSQILNIGRSIKRPRMMNRVGWNEDNRSAVRAREVE